MMQNHYNVADNLLKLLMIVDLSVFW